MTNQFILFITAIALGLALGALYKLCSLIAKRTNIRAMIYVFDIIWCGFAFGAFSLLTMVLADGKFHSFTLIGLIAGIGIAALIFSKVKKKQ